MHSSSLLVNAPIMDYFVFTEYVILELFEHALLLTFAATLRTEFKSAKIISFQFLAPKVRPHFTQKFPQIHALHGKVSILTVLALKQSVLTSFHFTEKLPQILALHRKVATLTVFALKQSFLTSSHFTQKLPQILALH